MSAYVSVSPKLVENMGPNIVQYGIKYNLNRAVSSLN